MTWLTVLGFGCHPAMGAITTDEMIRAIDTQIRANDGVRLEFEADCYVGETGSYTMVQAMPDASKFMFRKRCACTHKGSRFWWQSEFVRTNDQGKWLLGQKWAGGFDGSKYWSFIDYADSAKRDALTISEQVDSTTLSEQWLSANPWITMNHTALVSVSDLLKHSDCPSPQLDDTGQTVWVFEAKSQQGLKITGVRQSGEARLKELEYWVEGTGSPADRIVETKNIWNTECESDSRDGALVCTYVVQNYSMDANGKSQPDGRWMIVSIRQTLSTWNPDDSSIFDSPQHENMDIADSRYRIGYTLGRSDINLDGRVLYTHMPVHGDAGEELEYWITNGRLGPIEDTSGEDKRGSRANASAPASESK